MLFFLSHDVSVHLTLAMLVSSTYYQKFEWTVLMNCSVKLKVPVRIHLQKNTIDANNTLPPTPYQLSLTLTDD